MTSQRTTAPPPQATENAIEGVTVTAAAQRKIAALMAEEGPTEEHGERGLRIAIKGGGCAGLNYAFTFDTAAPDDWIYKEGVLVLIDPISLLYLRGSTLDYHASLLEARFVLQNPKATATCGCGHSFTVADEHA